MMRLNGLTGINPFPGTITFQDGTANGVPYFNGSKVLTTGSALTFDGTNLSSTGRFITTGGAGSTDASLGTLSGGVWLNTPSASTGYLAHGGNGTYTWTQSAHTWFLNSGYEQMRLTSTGLGIGTTSINTKLAIQSASDGSNSIRIRSAKGNAVDGLYGTIIFNSSLDAGYDAYGAAIAAGSTFVDAGDLRFFTSAGTARTERMRITDTGTLCIGTTSNLTSAFKANIENGRLAVSASSDQYALYLRYNTSILGAYIGSPAADSLAFSSSAGNERMRIDSSGNLLVGTTSNPVGGAVAKLGVQGGFSSAFAIATNDTTASGTAYHISFGRGGAQNGYISSNGTSTSYVTSSDYRLKENVEPMNDALSVVDQLNPVTYTWKADGSPGQGFIAHELQQVVPDCVTGEKDAVNDEGEPVYQGIDTSFLVATLTKAIQELHAELNELKAKVAA